MLVAVACSDPAVDSRGGPVPGVTRTFEGTWSASGPRRFASSYFSTITPQGGSQNVIFVGSGYLTQGELYRLGALTTAFCLLVFLLLGTPWLFLVVL
ncbi:MAG: anion permease [Candidatus Rokuibacteriota bacterium]